MKRYISSLVAVLVLFAVFSLNAFAADVTITGSRVECKPGQNVQIDIKISENSGAAAANIDLTFDSSALSFDKYIAGDALESQTMALGNLAQDGLFKFALVDIKGIKKGGVLFSAVFTVKESASGEKEIKITTPSLADAGSNKISADIKNAVIAVSGSAVKVDSAASEVEIVTESGVQKVSKSSLTTDETNSYTDQVASKQAEAVESKAAASSKSDDGNQGGTIGDKSSSQTADEKEKSGNMAKWIIIIAAVVVASAAIVVLLIMVASKRKQFNEAEAKLGKNDAILSDESVRNMQMQEELQNDAKQDDEQ